MSCRRAVVALLVVATLAGCGGTGGDKAGDTRAARPVVLSLAHTLDDADLLRPFLDEVGRASGGRLRIEPYAVPHKQTGGDESTVVEDVRTGRADLGLARRGDPAEQEELPVGARVAGVEPIGLLPGPPVRPAGTTRTLRGPDDYQGARIAVQGPGPTATSLVAFGATTVVHDLRGSDISRVDGLVAPVSAISRYGYDGIATTLTTNVALGSQPLVIFGRPGPSREILRAAARTAIPASAELQRTEERAAVTVLCRHGKIKLVDASDADIAALRTLWGRDPRASAEGAGTLTCDGVDGDGAITQIDGKYEITTDTGISILTLDRGLVSGESSRGSYILDGDLVTLTYPTGTEPVVYRWNSYRGELRLAPVAGANSPAALRARPWRRVGDTPPADRTPIDGVYQGDGRRWTFSRGQFAQTTDDELNSTRGSYSVSGDLLTATYAQIIGNDLAAGQVRPGETVSYRWNVYRGRLHLSPVDGALSPAIFSATTWRRVGDVP